MFIKSSRTPQKHKRPTWGSSRLNTYSYITNSEVHASPQWPWAVLEITDNTNKSFQLQPGTK